MGADPKNRYWHVAQRPGGDWTVSALDDGHIVRWNTYSDEATARFVARNLNAPSAPSARHGVARPRRRRAKSAVKNPPPLDEDGDHWREIRDARREYEEQKEERRR